MLEPEKTVTDDVYDDNGVRFDILLKDTEGTRIDVEMQSDSLDQEKLAVRGRYCIGMLDIGRIKKKAEYKLKAFGRSYVIFLCDFKIFDGKRKKYSCPRICKEDRRLLLGDKTEIVYLSSKGGEEDQVDEDLGSFLSYMNSGSDKWVRP